MYFCVKKFLITTIIAVAVGLFVQSLVIKEPKALANTTDSEVGSSVFKLECSVCHGEDGSGNTDIGKESKIPDLRSAGVQGKTDSELIKVISEGKGEMPSFEKKLDANKIKEVVAYIRQLKKK